jgi:site-specific DNA recombinase
VAATVAEARRQTDETIQRLKQERAALERQRRDDAAEVGRLSAANGAGTALAEVIQRDAVAVRRLADIREELSQLTAAMPTEQDVAAALATFDGVWNALTPPEQRSVLSELIDVVEFDGVAEEIEIAFRATGLSHLDGAAPLNEETAA